MPDTLRSTPKLRGSASLWPASPLSPDRSASELVMNTIARLDLWMSRAKQRRALAELDDRLLADVGIGRAEAARECGEMFWE